MLMITLMDGMESGLRKSIKKKLRNYEELIAKENMALVHALNQVVFEEYGPRRPDTRLCQSLSEILKDKFPQTFRVEKAVKSSLGTLKIKKSKGEGGSSALSKRIGDNFYSRVVSYHARYDHSVLARHRDLGLITIKTKTSLAK